MSDTPEEVQPGLVTDQPTPEDPSAGNEPGDVVGHIDPSDGLSADGTEESDMDDDGEVDEGLAEASEEQSQESLDGMNHGAGGNRPLP